MYYNHSHFFFINMGSDLGKPISLAQKDTYVCITRKADFEYLYWTCYFLWHSNAFNSILEKYRYISIPLMELNNIIKNFQVGLNFSPAELERFLIKIRRIERTERLFKLNSSLADDGRKLARVAYFPK